MDEASNANDVVNDNADQGVVPDVEDDKLPDLTRDYEEVDSNSDDEEDSISDSDNKVDSNSDKEEESVHDEEFDEDSVGYEEPR